MQGMYRRLPHYIYLKNEKYKINVDFRIFIEFEEEMQEGNIEEAVVNAFVKFFPAFSLILNNKELLNEAVDKFIWFYQCGHNEKPPEQKGKGSKERIFSYVYDDLYIWGAFKQYYHIDLSTIHLHWWQFRAMWLSLPTESQFTKIRGYRAYTGDDKDILDLKNMYKLPKSKRDLKDQVRHDKIFNQLSK